MLSDFLSFFVALVVGIITFEAVLSYLKAKFIKEN